MTVRFLADEDVDAAIPQALCSREPAIDVLDVKTAGLRAQPDSTLLELAVRQGRVLLTHDRRTMIRHFRDRANAGLPCPGLFILPQHKANIGQIVEDLLLIWSASQAEEWRNQIVYLPFF